MTTTNSYNGGPGTDAVAPVIEPGGPSEDEADSVGPVAAEGPLRFAFGAVALASSATRTAFTAAQMVQRASVSVIRVAGSAPGVRDSTPAAMTALDRLAARGQADLNAWRDALAPKVRAVTPVIVSQGMYFVDLDAVMAQLDLAGVISAALENIDLGAVMRDSTSTVAGETARGVRTQAVASDELVARLADRVLRRRTPRDTVPRSGLQPDTASST